MFRALSLFLLWAVTVTAVAQDSTAFYAAQLKNPDTRAAAFERLCARYDATTLPLLSAVHDKKLFLLHDSVLVITNAQHDSGDVRLFAAYPYRMLTDHNRHVFVHMDQLEEVEFSRNDRLSILPLLPYINLTSDDVEKRKLAYSQLGTKRDKPTLLAIRDALAHETDKSAKLIGTEAMYTIQLYMAPEAEQKLWLNKLAINHGPTTASILIEFMASGKARGEVHSYARELLTQVESRLMWLGIAQNIFSGLSLGSILMLIALGLAIIYGLAGVINMAHGEFLMIGAYTTFCVQTLFARAGYGGDAFFWVAMPASFLVAGVFGLATERLIVRKLYNRPMESLLATWGLSLVLIQVTRTLFGDLTAVRSPAALSGGWAIAPELVLPYNRVFIIVFSLFMIAVTYAFLSKTKMGLRIRSVTQNRNMSACLGIATAKVDSLTFFIGSAIAGVAGCCITLVGNVVPDMGQTYIVDSFLVVVTGGVGNLLGTISASLGVGFITKFLEPVFQAVYGKVILLALVILFLQIKPRGLFPAKGRLADE